MVWSIGGDCSKGAIAYQINLSPIFFAVNLGELASNGFLRSDQTDGAKRSQILALWSQLVTRGAHAVQAGRWICGGNVDFLGARFLGATV